MQFKEGVVPDLRRIVVDATTRLLTISPATSTRTPSLCRLFRVDNIGVVVLAVVVFQSLLGVMRAPGVNGERQGGQSVFHGCLRVLRAANAAIVGINQEFG